MHIEILYKSHRYEEFDTVTFVSAEPYRSRGANLLTDWNLHLEALAEKGVVLVQYWYTPDKENLVEVDGISVPAASRKPGVALLLVAPDELEELVWLKKDDEKILWREGDDLINGERYFAQEQLCYSDAGTKSINRRAVAVFDYLKKANPKWDDQTAAEHMGFTVQAIHRIQKAEISQSEGLFEESQGKTDEI